MMEHATDASCICADWSGAMVPNPECPVHFVQTAPTDAPTPGGQEAADQFLATWRLSGSPNQLALAFDDFARAVVEKERERVREADKWNDNLHTTIGKLQRGET
jgi:hypothetical protein